MAGLYPDQRLSPLEESRARVAAARLDAEKRRKTKEPSPKFEQTDPRPLQVGDGFISSAPPPQDEMVPIQGTPVPGEKVVPDQPTVEPTENPQLAASRERLAKALTDLNAGAAPSGSSAPSGPSAPSRPSAPSEAEYPADDQDTIAGGHIGTSPGDEQPSILSRQKYQNFSNNHDVGVRALRRDNPDLDFDYTDHSGPIYRKKLPQGQTKSTEEWHPLDPYDSPLQDPAAFYNKYKRGKTGLEGAATSVYGMGKELVQDALDNTVDMGSAFLQTAATTAGGLQGGTAGSLVGSAAGPVGTVSLGALGGAVGAARASAASGLALNSAKQALGVASGYGEYSLGESALAATLSYWIPKILGSGVAEKQVQKYVDMQVDAIRSGSSKALKRVNDILSSQQFANIPATAERNVKQFVAEARKTLHSQGLKRNPANTNPLAKALQQKDWRNRWDSAMSENTINNAKDALTKAQQGFIKNTWDKMGGQDSLSTRVMRWARETVPVDMVQNIAQAANMTLPFVDMTRRQLAEFVKGFNLSKAVYLSSQKAIQTMSSYMDGKYTAALASVTRNQDYAAVRQRIETRLKGALLDGVHTLNDKHLYDKVMEYVDKNLVIQSLEPKVVSQVTAQKALKKGLKDLINSPDLPPDVRPLVRDMAELSLLELGQGKWDWGKVRGALLTVIQKKYDTVASAHTAGNKGIQDRAMAAIDKWLLLSAPESKALPRQWGPVPKLFGHIQALEGIVKDAEIVAKGAVGRVAHIVTDQMHKEKAQLYSLLPDQNLRENYKKMLRLRDRLEALFPTEQDAAIALHRPTSITSASSDTDSILFEADKWLHDIRQEAEVVAKSAQRTFIEGAKEFAAGLRDKRPVDTTPKWVKEILDESSPPVPLSEYAKIASTASFFDESDSGSVAKGLVGTAVGTGTRGLHMGAYNFAKSAIQWPRSTQVMKDRLISEEEGPGVIKRILKYAHDTNQSLGNAKIDRWKFLNVAGDKISKDGGDK